MINLFEDQLESVNKLRQSLKRHKRVLMQGETGSGKSVMASYMIKNALDKGKKCAFIVPRKELLRQMSETFDSFGIHHSYVAAGKEFNPFASVHLCTVGTLVNKLDKISPDIIFEDEVHYGNEQRNKINEHFTKNGTWIVGLTATPDNPFLCKWYDDIVIGKSIKELIALKRLSDFRYFAPSTPDLSIIDNIGNDYHKGQIDEFMREQSYLIGDAVAHYKKFAMGKLNMTFCTSIRNSNLTVQRFNDAGIPSAHMDGETPEEDRRRIARDFALGRILNLCTVDLCLFGYDLSSASGIKGVAVQSMSDLRPSKSKNVQRQKIGRVLRYKDEPALIFDHSSNYKEHNLPDHEIKWKLEPPKKSKKDTEKTLPTRQCPQCFFVHTPSPICPNCNHVYEIKSREIDEKDGELIEISKESMAAVKKDARKEQGRADTLEDLIAIGKKRGYKSPSAWASRVLAGRMMKNARN